MLCYLEKIKSKKLILLSAFVLFVTDCGTTYQPKGFLGGCSETRLGENIFRVTFEGDEFTSKDRVADFTLLYFVLQS